MNHHLTRNLAELSLGLALCIASQAHAGHEGKQLVGWVHLLGNSGMAVAGTATAALARMDPVVLHRAGVSPRALGRVQLGLGCLSLVFGASGLALHPTLSSARDLKDLASINLGVSLLNLGIGAANLVLGARALGRPEPSGFVLAPLAGPDARGRMVAGVAVSYRAF